MMGQFSATLSNICDDIKDVTDDHIRKVVFDVAKSLVMKSPVGNPALWKHAAPSGYVGGHFRRNWQYGFGVRPTDEINGVEGDVSTSLGRLEVAINSHPAVGIHYLTNNVPYAQALEDGWSGQAPAGMVGLTVLQFQ